MMSPRVNPTAISDPVSPSGFDLGGAHGCSALDALLAMMSACAPDIYAHVRRVSQIATATARMMDLPAPIVEQVEQAALLHDLGKLALTEQSAPSLGVAGELQAVLVRQHVRIGGLNGFPNNGSRAPRENSGARERPKSQQVFHEARVEVTR